MPVWGPSAPFMSGQFNGNTLSWNLASPAVRVEFIRPGNCPRCRLFVHLAGQQNVMGNRYYVPASLSPASPSPHLQYGGLVRCAAPANEGK
jgi:hypothetical protein